jgi:hypothetical protein
MSSISVGQLLYLRAGWIPTNQRAPFLFVSCNIRQMVGFILANEKTNLYYLSSSLESTAMAARFLGLLHFLVLVASDSEPLGETSHCLDDLERARERERLFLNCERAQLLYLIIGWISTNQRASFLLFSGNIRQMVGFILDN